MVIARKSKEKIGLTAKLFGTLKVKNPNRSRAQNKATTLFVHK